MRLYCISCVFTGVKYKLIFFDLACLMFPGESCENTFDPVTALQAGYFYSFCCHLLTFFKFNFFKKNLSGTLSEG